MYIKQIYNDCISQIAYYIESNGEAAVVDPVRDINPYMDIARERNAKIKYVFETHFHSDYISGHLELARATEAKIIFGPTAEANFDFYMAKNNEGFLIGEVMVKALHTPGHTLESTCYLLLDKHHKPHAIFTGDTLFIGNVGRPDLADGQGFEVHDMADLLYKSIKSSIFNLPDSILTFPGHGDGAYLDFSMSDEIASTIGTQKVHNPMLQLVGKEDFIEKVIESTPLAYNYTKAVREINKRGYESLDEVLNKSLIPLSVNAFKNEMQNGTFVIDTRSAEDFSKFHIPGSVNIGLNGAFSIWVGIIVEKLDTPIALICEDGMQEEIMIRLARTGFENIRGYLLRGMDAWMHDEGVVMKIPTIDPNKFNAWQNDHPIIDLRMPKEIDNKISGTRNISLYDLLEKYYTELNQSETYYLLCKTGYKSAIGASILQKMGYNNIVNVLGGVDALNNKFELHVLK